MARETAQIVSNQSIWRTRSALGDFCLSTDEPHLAGRDGRLQLVHVDSVELYSDAVILVGFL